MAFLEAALSRTQVEARQIDVGKVLLTLLLVVPFVLGWSARMAVRGTVWSLSFAGAACKVGWQAAAPPARGG